ncbi:hypothetical protein P7K49_021095 [Saguinus oedipus]|uniref:Uncharacterized protein n=1 Tax=Saguinus oedipus TaxID=9490 RepID=A0ABQ9URR3_SAGOE|nr:hypothetical protein P7K49_021095 [Saguinus oedipus]
MGSLVSNPAVQLFLALTRLASPFTGEVRHDEGHSGHSADLGKAERLYRPVLMGSQGMGPLFPRDKAKPSA